MSAGDTAQLGAAGAVAVAPLVTGDPVVGGASLVTLLVWLALAALRYATALEQRRRAEAEAWRARLGEPSHRAGHEPSQDVRDAPGRAADAP